MTPPASGRFLSQRPNMRICTYLIPNYTSRRHYYPVLWPLTRTKVLENDALAGPPSAESIPRPNPASHGLWGLKLFRYWHLTFARTRRFWVGRGLRRAIVLARAKCLRRRGGVCTSALASRMKKKRRKKKCRVFPSNTPVEFEIVCCQHGVAPRRGLHAHHPL